MARIFFRNVGGAKLQRLIAEKTMCDSKNLGPNRPEKRRERKREGDL